MPGHDIITIGASAGGVEALQKLVSSVPANLPAAIFVVLHLPPDAPSMLPLILEKSGNLPAVVPVDQMPIAHGHIYVAPPDHHLLVEPERVRVVHGPKENRHRPAIDPLFRSAAWSYGRRVVGIVLSGALDDGTAGLWAVKASGGVTVVQDPAEALFPDMPTSALRNVTVDHCLPIDGIATLLSELPNRSVQGAPSHAPKKLKTEIEFLKMKKDLDDMSQLGNPTAFACPSCHGALWELKDGELARYRCHTGHAFSPESLVAAQSDDVEEALYSALRALQEKATTLRRLAAHYERLPDLKSDYELRAAEAEESAESIRTLLNGKEP